MNRILLLTLPLVLATHCATSSKRRNLAQEEENKRIVQTFAEEVYVQHRLERIPVYIAEDFVDLSDGAPANARGPAYIRAQEEASLQELPGLQFRILHLLAEGDLVHMHWKAEGPVQLTGHTLFQLKQERIVASWSVVDTLGLMLQQGFQVLPPVPEPPPKP
jgi:predicted SnoaL-like aldol condensation-catalyzing enzyme